MNPNKPYKEPSAKKFALLLLVSVVCLASVAASLWGVLWSIAASPGAVALSRHPFFKGQITPQQAEQLIQAAMQLGPEYPGLDFNDLGDFCLRHKAYYRLVPLNPGEHLTKEQEFIRSEGERLRGSDPIKLHPRAGGNLASLARIPGNGVPQPFGLATTNATAWSPWITSNWQLNTDIKGVKKNRKSFR
jgi:hypothetical protein